MSGIGSGVGITHGESPSPFSCTSELFLWTLYATTLYKFMSKKKEIDSKVLAVRVPTPVFEKFQAKCEADGFRMSEVVRLYIRFFSDDATNGPTEPMRQLMKRMLKTTGDK